MEQAKPEQGGKVYYDLRPRFVQIVGDLLGSFAVLSFPDPGVVLEEHTADKAPQQKPERDPEPPFSF